MSWFDWRLTEQNKDMLSFTTGMISFRRRHPCLMRTQFLTGRKGRGDVPDVSWHGWRLNDPNWGDPGTQVLAYTLAGTDEMEEHLHIMLNMSDKTLQMELPIISGRKWYRVIDTSQPSPFDIIVAADQPKIVGNTYQMAARSVVVLEGR